MPGKVVRVSRRERLGLGPAALPDCRGLLLESPDGSVEWERI